MSNRTLIYMTSIIIGSILLLTLANLLSIFWNPYPATYIGLNQIRGSAVQYQGKIFTLNFEQQNEFVDLLNRSIIVSRNDRPSAQKPVIEKVILYLFDDQPEITITPIALSKDNNYTFFIPAWKPNQWFVDVSGGVLHKLLSQTYE